MRCTSFEEAVEQIHAEDPRYDRQAYWFLREALDYTVDALKKPQKGPQRHVSGQELIEGVRKFAIDEFGPVSKLVLNSWGITKTVDFGDLVFNLVEKGVLGKTDSDTKDDFSSGYDFDRAFVYPFLPESQRKAFEQDQNDDEVNPASKSGASGLSDDETTP